MANKASRPASPLTFDLPVSLIGKIETVQKRMGLASTSEVVRLAIAQFNFDRFEAEAEEHRQISVRLPSDLKSVLTRTAKKKKASVGELLRVALADLAKTKPAGKAAAGTVRRRKG